MSVPEFQSYNDSTWPLPALFRCKDSEFLQAGGLVFGSSPLSHASLHSRDPAQGCRNQGPRKDPDWNKTITLVALPKPLSSGSRGTV